MDKIILVKINCFCFSCTSWLSFVSSPHTVVVVVTMTINRMLGMVVSVLVVVVVAAVEKGVTGDRIPSPILSATMTLTTAASLIPLPPVLGTSLCHVTITMAPRQVI